MTTEFEQCLQKGKIVKYSRASALISKEIRTAEEDLNEAQDRFKNARFKYATIMSYYAMFHAARALLYKKGYREKSHFCLIAALKSLYVFTKELDIFLVEALQKGKTLRENADYYDTFSREGAENHSSSLKCLPADRQAFAFGFVGIATKPIPPQ